jgi:capsular polysaccharide biosynthesis protein
MELKNLFAILKRNWLWLILPLILIPIAAGVFTKIQKPQPTATFSITLAPINQNQTNSNSNQLQLANLLTGTAKSWLSDPALVSEILQNAGVDPSNYSNAQLAKLFTITLADNSFALTAQIQGTTTDQATALANSAVNLVNAKVKEFDQNAKNGITFAVQASTPYISQEKTDLKINLLLGILAGLAIGLILVLGKHYVEN